jgi:hypothetical protein
MRDFDRNSDHDLCLKREYELGGDVLNGVNQGNWRALKDWNSTEFDPSGSWNTVARLDRSLDEYFSPGFAAEGMICGGPPPTDPTDCDDPSDSIADGRYGYDSTTGTYGPDGVTLNPQPRGQELTFVDKPPIEGCGTGPECYEDNAADTISYPFERKSADAARLKQLALNTDGWYRGPNPDLDTLLTGGRSRVVFIDAQNETLTWDGGGGTKTGVLVVWCGNLDMTDVKFQGIIMTLTGDEEEVGEMPLDPSGEPSSTCDPEDPLVDQGKFSVTDSTLKAWFYAEGGDVTDPGIDIGPRTNLDFLPSGTWNLLDLILEDATPTHFALQGWRECYQIADATQCGT